MLRRGEPVEIQSAADLLALIQAEQAVGLPQQPVLAIQYVAADLRRQRVAGKEAELASGLQAVSTLALLKTAPGQIQLPATYSGRTVLGVVLLARGQSHQTVAAGYQIVETGTLEIGIGQKLAAVSELQDVVERESRLQIVPGIVVPIGDARALQSAAQAGLRVFHLLLPFPQPARLIKTWAALKTDVVEIQLPIKVGQLQLLPSGSIGGEVDTRPRAASTLIDARLINLADDDLTGDGPSRIRSPAGIDGVHAGFSGQKGPIGISA